MFIIYIYYLIKTKKEYFYLEFFKIYFMKFKDQFD